MTGISRSVWPARILGLATCSVIAVAVGTSAAAVTGISSPLLVSGGVAGAVTEFSSVSGDGRFVAISTPAALVPADTNGLLDVYLRDLDTSAVVWVSRPTAGVVGAPGTATDPVVSADGAFVVFTSGSAQLVAGDGNGAADVFRYTVASGTIERVTTPETAPGTSPDGPSGKPDVSQDGRFVVFESDATNLEATPDGNPSRDVFVRDMSTSDIARVSITAAGFTAGGFHREPSISADGRLVAFDSNSPTLVAGDTNQRFDVFVRDLVANTTVRASVTSGGVQTQGLNCGASPNTGSLDPDISADGRVVVFVSVCSDLVPSDASGFTDVFAHDLTTGVTERVSIDDGGYAAIELIGDSFAPSVSSDGRFVAFWSRADNVDYLVPGLPGVEEAFIRDRATQQNSALTPGSRSLVPQISADATRVSLASPAALVPGDGNGLSDVYALTVTPDPIGPLYVLPMGSRGPRDLMAAIDAVMPEIQVVTLDDVAGTYDFPGCQQAPALPGARTVDYQAAFAGGDYVNVLGGQSSGIPRECRANAVTTY